MSYLQDLPNMRQEYGDLSLLESSLHENPIDQFTDWFNKQLEFEKNTPNSMVLSTVDSQGCPDSRVVLLKGLDKSSFIFYTNYDSAKGSQLSLNPHVALNFYWPELMRQVRVRGLVQRVDGKTADEYFHSRPIASQLSAIVSHQSAEIESREALDIELHALMQDYANQVIPRPLNWGGFAVTPEEIEFWQGRNNRLHDRIQYFRDKNKWCHRRLAP